MNGEPVHPSRDRYVVLVVDDNLDNLEILVHVAQSLGCNVIKGLTGSDALMLAVQLRPDLILLELSLPDIDGFTVLQHLRSQQHTRHIPVIAVTALASACDRNKIAAAGFDDFLIKPYVLSDLKTIIHRHLMQ